LSQYTAMFALGLLSLLQVVFLPGYLLGRALGVRGGLATTLPIAFALSLLANHLLVVGLVTIGAYRSGVVYTLLALEIAVWLWIDRRGWTRRVALGWPTRDALGGALRRQYGAGPYRSPAQALVLGGVTALVVISGLVEIARLGSIFTAWDAVVSWNAWAIQWAQGQFPANTADYPQLLPTNYSLTYVFLQTTEVWLFAKGFVGLFAVLLLMALLDAGRRWGDYAYVLAAALAWWLLWAFVRFRDFSSGYADVPVAFFSLLALLQLAAAARCTQSKHQWQSILLGALLAAGAALTKQMALLVAGVYPALVWLILRPTMSGRRLLQAAIVAALLIAVLTIPWYAAKLVQFYYAQDTSQLGYLTGEIHAGRTWPQRLLFALHLVGRNIPWPLGLAAVTLLLAGLRDRVWRWPVLLIVVPYAIIWAAVFGYEARNLAMIIGPAAVAMGCGLAGWLPGWRSVAASEPLPTALVCRGPRGVPAWSLALALAAIVGGASWAIGPEPLLARQQRLQREVGAAEVNRGLYDYAAAPGFTGAILTDYWFLRWLPELQQRARPSSLVSRSDFEAAYHDPAVQHVLLNVRRNAAEGVPFLERETAAGRCRAVGQWGDYRLYTKAHPPRPNADSPR